MLANLLYYQFAFLYLLVLLIGLVVYGSDFKGISGWIYVVPLILMAVVHKWVWSLRSTLSTSGSSIKIISGVGAVLALIAYTPMHMGYWDEHSLSQAWLMALLGICSYLLCVIAATRIAHQQISGGSGAVLALLIIGLLWLPARQYPLIILLALCVLFIVAFFWLSPLQATHDDKSDIRLRSDPFAKYAVFLAAIDLGCVVWDYEVNTQWAWYVAVSFFAAAIGYYIGRGDDKSDQMEQSVYAAIIGNFLAAIIWPAYILWFLHVGVAGFCMGYLLPAAVFPSLEHYRTKPLMGWITAFFLGVALSNAWYANLYWASTRIVLLLPFAILAALYLFFRYSALKHRA